MLQSGIQRSAVDAGLATGNNGKRRERKQGFCGGGTGDRTIQLQELRGNRQVSGGWRAGILGGNAGKNYGGKRELGGPPGDGDTARILPRVAFRSVETAPQRFHSRTSERRPGIPLRGARRGVHGT